MELNQSIKAVLFDYGGVLAEEGFRNGLLALAREQHLDLAAMPAAAMQAVYDSGFVLGKGLESDFWTLLRKRTGLRGSDDTLTQRILDGFVLRPWMIALVKQLRVQGYVTGILSDQTNWLDWLNTRDHFYDAFDHIFNSFHMGRGKRDASLFLLIAAKLAVEPGEILFVDDSEENITRARGAGWQVIRYVDKAHFLTDIDRLLSVPRQ